MATGVVKWWNNDKGYGFIAQPDGTDVFVHFSAVQKPGFRTLTEGEQVDFDVQTGPKGMQAANVRPNDSTEGSANSERLLPAASPEDLIALTVDDERLRVVTIAPDGTGEYLDPTSNVHRLLYVWSAETSALAEAVREFESLLNDSASREHHFQDFFSRHREFIRGDEYRDALPHVYLQRDGSTPLVPDFILQPVAPTQLSDILELTAMEPVQRALGGAVRARLVPLGPLALVPWSAAWWTEDGSDRRRYAIDSVTLTFAPPLLSHLRLSPPQPGGRIVAICDPSSNTLPPLPSARLEAAGMAAALPGVERLEGAECTRAAVMAALGNADVAHVACHAVADVWDPGGSHLSVAGDEHITVADLDAGRFGTRLVVLSACETDAAGRLLADEALTLTGALLTASVTAAIGSAWLAPDDATAAIVTKFYELWVDHQLTPGDALGGAQRWFRDGETVDIERYMSERTSSSDRLVLDYAGLHHSHPLFWAALAYTGP